jgi:hypothetical protein
VYGVLIRASARWRRVKMGEREKNQLRIIREDLKKKEIKVWSIGAEVEGLIVARKKAYGFR